MDIAFIMARSMSKSHLLESVEIAIKNYRLNPSPINSMTLATAMHSLINKFMIEDHGEAKALELDGKVKQVFEIITMQKSKQN